MTCYCDSVFHPNGECQRSLGTRKVRVSPEQKARLLALRADARPKPPERPEPDDSPRAKPEADCSGLYCGQDLSEESF